MKILIFSLAASILLASCSCQNQEVVEAVRALDTVISQKQSIEDAKNQRIANLKAGLEASAGKEDLYYTLNDIFNEYFQYDVDSAIFYAHKKLDLAIEMERKDLILDAEFDMADRYVTSGMYQEALEIVSQIDTVKIQSSHRWLCVSVGGLRRDFMSISRRDSLWMMRG